MGKTKGCPDDPMEDGQQTGSRGGSSHKGKHLNEWPPGIFFFSIPFNHQIFFLLKSDCLNLNLD